MKIAITGANGFVGRSLTSHLIEKNHHIAAITRRPLSSLNSSIENWVFSNYSDANLQNSLNGYDCIIHLAALTHTNSKPTPQNLEKYRQVNVKNTLELAATALKTGVKRFIYLSSIKVNGERSEKTPFSYNTPPKPEDAYGISKWEAEQALHNSFKATGVELVIVRPPLIWSPKETKGNLGKLEKWLKLGLPLPSFTKYNRRDILSLGNLCDFLIICVGHIKAPGHTFLISDGIPRSSAEIAKVVTGVEPKLMPLPKWALKFTQEIGFFNKLSSNLEIDIAHTKSILSWQPKTQDASQKIH